MLRHLSLVHSQNNFLLIHGYIIHCIDRLLRWQIVGDVVAVGNIHLLLTGTAIRIFIFKLLIRHNGRGFHRQITIKRFVLRAWFIIFVVVHLSLLWLGFLRHLDAVKYLVELVEIEHAIAIVVASPPNGFDMEFVHLHHNELVALQSFEQVEVEAEWLQVLAPLPGKVKKVHGGQLWNQGGFQKVFDCRDVQRNLLFRGIFILLREAK